VEALVADPAAAGRSYGTRPAEGGNKVAKLRAIREALRTAKRVWLATDCDREGQLIGQEILEHYEYRGQVMRVLFTAQDSQTIRDAFGRAKPNSEYARLYAAAVARRQADQIYNLSLTRTATVILGQGARRVIGVGRVKTPTLAIVCKRELEIRNFVPIAHFEVVATAKVAGGQFQMRHAPQERILKREVAETVVNVAQGFEGALGVRVEDKRQGPPKLHDLPSLQKLCGSRFGWPASKTLEVAQELYDGQGKKIITYPRAEVRYLPQSLISDVPKIVAGLQVGQSFSAIPVPDPPVIRRGASSRCVRRHREGGGKMLHQFCEQAEGATSRFCCTAAQALEGYHRWRHYRRAQGRPRCRAGPQPGPTAQARCQARSWRSALSRVALAAGARIGPDAVPRRMAARVMGAARLAAAAARHGRCSHRPTGSGPSGAAKRDRRRCA
jgi:hypothetical protein